LHHHLPAHARAPPLHAGAPPLHAGTKPASFSALLFRKPGQTLSALRPRHLRYGNCGPQTGLAKLRGQLADFVGLFHHGVFVNLFGRHQLFEFALNHLQPGLKVAGALACPFDRFANGFPLLLLHFGASLFGFLLAHHHRAAAPAAHPAATHPAATHPRRLGHRGKRQQ